MGQALYRKYRSKSLDEIVGQSHITDMLGKAIVADKIAHAYLLTGPRGVGKTSIARILAHEINSLPYDDESTHLDIVEIDAASNNGVDDIRDLRDKVQIAPTSARKKVYIIDEVHMLSKPAFNALLKTLEEPPEHVVFILATTDVDKLPATIISRVQRFNFRAIGEQDATAHLRKIADAEKIKITDDALALLAHQGKGSFRDSISLLDQFSSLGDGPITRELVEGVLGLADADTVAQLLAAYEAHDLKAIVQLVGDSEARGTPAVILAEQLIRSIREQIVEKPHLLSLLDNLLEITRSAWPHIKLLTALSSDMPRVPAPAAAPRPTPALKSSLPEAPKAPKPPKATIATAATQPEVKVEPLATPKPATKKPATAQVTEFPWQDFLTALKTESMGTYTLLTKCAYDYSDGVLTLYAGKPFSKNRLEKTQSTIQAAMASVGVPDAELAILAESKPASDSQTAAVLAMMGGGEEVQI